MYESTKFNDKTGKPIRIGDVVQHRLGGKGLPPKHGGPSIYRVIQPGKKVRLAPLQQSPEVNEGVELTGRLAESLVIVDRAHK